MRVKLFAQLLAVTMLEQAIIAVKLEKGHHSVENGDADLAQIQAESETMTEAEAEADAE